MAVESNGISLAIIPHIDVEMLKSQEVICEYRHLIISMARKYQDTILHNGLFVVGVQDIRIEQKLIPLGMLIMEDILKCACKLRLKEFILAVPKKYAKDPENEILDHTEITSALDKEFNPTKFLPIVHVFIFLLISGILFTL